MRRNITPLLFLFPALILLITFVFYPTIATIWTSFLSWRGWRSTGFAGLHNYIEVLSRSSIINLRRSFLKGPPLGALPHNIIWVVIHVPLSTFLGLLLAVLLRRVRGGFLIKSVIFLGMVIPMIVGGILLRFIYDEHAGVVNAVLRAIGLGWMARTWTAYPDTALFALIFGSVWIWTGFSMIVYSAGLEGIPEELYEAAKIDGASRLQIFRHITIPMLKPATMTVVMMTVLWVLKIFDIVYVATFGGPGRATTVLALEMYLDLFFKIPSNPGTAAAIATLLTLITLAFAVYMVRVAMVRR